jgi:ribonuclease HI
MRAIAHFDGGARPTNPGHAGIGIVLDLDGTEHILSRYIGIHTNNYAEWTACVVAIKFAAEHQAEDLKLVTDSKLVRHQLDGSWKARQAELRPFLTEAQKLLDWFFRDAWRIEWVRRDLNAHADSLCTSAINAGRNRNPFTPQKIKDKRVGKITDPFAVEVLHAKLRR